MASLLHCPLQHVHIAGSYTQLLFINFSLNFQQHHVIKKLQHLQVSSPLIHWTHHFLSNRRQAVRVDSWLSHTIAGAPQGCVLSPSPYTLYTKTCLSSSTTMMQPLNKNVSVCLLTMAWIYITPSMTKRHLKALNRNHYLFTPPSPW